MCAFVVTSSNVPSPFIVIKNILRARKSARAAHHRDALPHTRRALSRRRRSGEIEIHVIRHHQIELAVAVVVDERASRAPRFARTRHAGLLRHFGEDTVIVVIEPVLAVVRDVQIFPTIVVVVADANALSPAGRCQIRLWPLRR